MSWNRCVIQQSVSDIEIGGPWVSLQDMILAENESANDSDAPASVLKVAASDLRW